jgi:hypothetical protein
MTPFINMVHGFVKHFGFKLKNLDVFLDLHMLLVAPYNV